MIFLFTSWDMLVPWRVYGKRYTFWPKWICFSKTGNWFITGVPWCRSWSAHVYSGRHGSFTIAGETKPGVDEANSKRNICGTPTVLFEFTVYGFAVYMNFSFTIWICCCHYWYMDLLLIRKSPWKNVHHFMPSRHWHCTISLSQSQWNILAQTPAFLVDEMQCFPQALLTQPKQTELLHVIWLCSHCSDMSWMSRWRLWPSVCLLLPSFLKVADLRQPETMTTRLWWLLFLHVFSRFLVCFAAVEWQRFLFCQKCVGRIRGIYSQWTPGANCLPTTEGLAPCGPWYFCPAF